MTIQCSCNEDSCCFRHDTLSHTFASAFCVLQRYREGLQLLCQAYDSDPRNPAVLNLLAHHCLTRKEYAKVSRIVSCSHTAYI